MNTRCEISKNIVSTNKEDKPLIYISEEAIYLKRNNDKLKEENKRLNKGLEYAKRIEKDYKTKFDKAIEYVNTHKPSDTITFPLMKKDEENQVKSCFDYEFEKIYKKELLDILQGVDKE